MLVHGLIVLLRFAAALVLVGLVLRYPRALLRFLVGLVLMFRAPLAVKRNYLLSVWAPIRWRWLTRNLGLAHVDPHSKVKFRGAIGPSVGRNVRIEKPKAKILYPRAVIRPDAYGVVAKVKTVPKVGRLDFEKSAEDIANYWRCVRVQVAQPKPGRLVVRGLRKDPLAVRFGPEGAPAGVYANPNPFRPYLGRDEWATDRFLSLAGVTGITVGGLPGYGKTSLILSLLCQLIGSDCVQFVFLDGKGGGDYVELAQRAWLSCGDELDEAAGIVGQVHELMRYRLANVVQLTGGRNAWHRGPTPDFPLIVTIVDECHTYLDLEGVKGDKNAEASVRAIRHDAGQLVKKGRSVLMLTIFITQKQTGDAIPTAIRDNCAVGLSFAVKTTDAAVAALGESIKQYPSSCPTGLQDMSSYIGVATASLRTGSDPFVRIRVPEISEEAADQRARETAYLRRDPTTLLRLVPGQPDAA